MSGPIAMMVAGLLIGNLGRAYAMSTTTEHLDTFRQLVDEILNAVLVVLIVLEVLALTLTGKYLLIGLAVVRVVLLARLVSVVAPFAALGPRGRFGPAARTVLTWGGLWGGISVALAMSIPAVTEEREEWHAVPERGVLVALTYLMVVFSILAQGSPSARSPAAGSATGRADRDSSYRTAQNRR